VTERSIGKAPTGIGLPASQTKAAPGGKDPADPDRLQKQDARQQKKPARCWTGLSELPHGVGAMVDGVLWPIKSPTVSGNI